jgi:chemotaxis protein CheC
MDLTEDRRDTLAELLNIGFGRSMASLAELMDIYIELSVPSVRIVRPHQILEALSSSVAGREEVTLIEQTFRGAFNGEAVLALPGEASHTLARMLAADCGFSPDMEPDKLHLEAMLELGNIVIGACLGKFAEILESNISFNPPQVFLDSVRLDRMRRLIPLPDQGALLVLTHFRLAREEVTGYMFIFIGSDGLEALFRAVDRFLDELAETG